MGRIKIELDNCNNDTHVFVPGEIVRGKVIYTIFKEEKLVDAAIYFLGLCETVIRQGNDHNDKHREKILMFQNRTEAFKGPYTVAPQTMEWPFEFQFPSHCSYDRGDATEWHHSFGPMGGEDSSTLFTPPGTIALPPSFYKDGMGFTSYGDASITYSLQVKLNEDSFRHHLEGSLRLHFTPLVEPSPERPLRTLDLNWAYFASDELSDTKRTFKQKLKHSFTSDATLAKPGIRFRTRIGLPPAIGQDHRTPLSISVTHKPVSPADIRNPNLVVDRISLALLGVTHYRSRGSMRDFVRDATAEEGSADYDGLKAAIPSAGSKDDAVEDEQTQHRRTEIYPIADFGLHSFKKAWLLTPDFTTWTVSHRHYLDVKVYIRHVESGHVFKVEKKRVPIEVLLPAERPAEKRVQQGQRPPMYANVPSQEAPPQYDAGEGGSNGVQASGLEEKGVGSKV